MRKSWIAAGLLVAGTLGYWALKAGGQTRTGSSGKGPVSLINWVQYAPDPDNLWNFFQDGTKPAYTVPAGHDLVITDWFTRTGHAYSMSINGVQVGLSFPVLYPFNGSWEPGLVAHAGEAVDIIGANPTDPTGLSGYLVEVPAIPFTVRTTYTPTPDQVVFLNTQLGSPYVVPAGVHLVIQAGDGVITINGIEVWEMSRTPNGDAPPLHSGVIAKSGDSVLITFGGMGYLKP